MDTWTKESLPPLDDPSWEFWQKRPAIVAMRRLEGPARIVTIDAPTELPEGWKGWLAVDANGHPYPLHEDVQRQMYEPPMDGKKG